MERMKFVLWEIGFVCFVVLSRWVNGFEDLNVTEVSKVDGYNIPPSLMVPLTLIQGAGAKGAVCLDGTLPGYHWHRGYGSGANSWIVNLEGGGWCNNRRTCVFRTTTRRGSSAHMEKQIPFTGILSNKAEENPDFFNWNRVKLRYCDGASFTGDSEDQALLSGCSAGGLATILHCDEFRGLFSSSTKVKCLSDGGMFLDASDVSGGRTLRNMFEGVVSLQGLQKNLPPTCTNHMDPTSCFFPQNLIANVRTPMFLLNAAYDAWQVQASLIPPAADPQGYWTACKKDHLRCSTSQIQFFQGFRNQMLNAIKGFSVPQQNGLFINSCFAHCQSERQDTWFSDNSPLVHNKEIVVMQGIAQSVGDWYFDRSGVKEIDCPYPCDKSCHNLVFS
ncbi:hypothetical protein IFM89_038092 [Coptis chinensis]|uniref:Pectin acetylesterase n=1 Tax=Coptis chinensis TaxID=261450 RepID=A0A835LH05_9MAGN|nr:hypothetical protein IFM89_038092 [Coptis chinensis]